MPVSGFTNALNAMSCSNRWRATAAFTARMEQALARRFRKAASQADVAASTASRWVAWSIRDLLRRQAFERFQY
jgi:hypothetical protein